MEQLRYSQLSSIEHILLKENIGMAQKITQVRTAVTGLLSFYSWYTGLDIKGIFLDALIIQMRLDHGHDIDFDYLRTSDYKACWNKVLDGYMEGRRKSDLQPIKG